jgi:hypothetical protein
VFWAIGASENWEFEMRQRALFRSREGKKWEVIVWRLVILCNVYLSVLVCSLDRIKLVLSPTFLLNYFFYCHCNCVSYETLIFCLHFAMVGSHFQFVFYIYGNTGTRTEKVYSNAIHVFLQMHSLQFPYVIGIDVHLLQTKIHCFSCRIIAMKLIIL